MIDGQYNFTFKSKKPTDFAKLRKTILFGLLGLLLIIGIFTSFYTVDDKQQAVVTTFGKVTDITDPGLHFKLPFGNQKAQKVDVNVYQKIELGYITDANGNTKTVNDESTMITGDYNIVNVDFFVEYRFLTRYSTCFPPTIRH